MGRKPPRSWVRVQKLAASPMLALCRSHAARSRGRTRSTAVGGALACRRRSCEPTDHEPPPEDTPPPVRGHWKRWGRGFRTCTQSRRLHQCPETASNISSKRAYTTLAAVRAAPEPDYHGMRLGAAPQASVAGPPLGARRGALLAELRARGDRSAAWLPAATGQRVTPRLFQSVGVERQTCPAAAFGLARWQRLAAPSVCHSPPQPIGWPPPWRTVSRP